MVWHFPKRSTTPCHLYHPERPTCPPLHSSPRPASPHDPWSTVQATRHASPRQTCSKVGTSWPYVAAKRAHRATTAARSTARRKVRCATNHGCAKCSSCIRSVCASLLSCRRKFETVCRFSRTCTTLKDLYDLSRHRAIQLSRQPRNRRHGCRRVVHERCA